MTQSKPLEWVYGRPIKISLRWAKDGSHIPVKVTNPEGDITGRTVTYEFENLWSLPRLLARFMAGPEDFQRPGNEKPHTLKFAFQTREWNEEEAKKDLYLPKTSESQVFIRVGVKNPKEKKMLVFPQLPGKAPHLKKDFQS